MYDEPGRMEEEEAERPAERQQDGTELRKREKEILENEAGNANDKEQNEREESRASIRRDSFPAKPLTPQSELARIRRREKKVLGDEIRAERKARKGAKKEAEEPEEALQISIYGRQKRKRILWKRSEGWSRFRKRIIRAFALKKTEWSFDERKGQKPWIPVTQYPLMLDEAKDYRVRITSGKHRIAPGKTQSKKEKRALAIPPPRVEKPLREPLKIERPPKENPQEYREERCDPRNPKFFWENPQQEQEREEEILKREQERER
jgi:hypothetical protein